MYLPLSPVWCASDETTTTSSSTPVYADEIRYRRVYPRRSYVVEFGLVHVRFQRVRQQY